MSQQSEPIFNIPAVLMALIGAMLVIHGVREYLLTDDQDLELLLRFAFIPARYGTPLPNGVAFPDGIAGDIWTFFTHAFLHANWTHVTVNLIWLLPFGSAVARRFGASRFIAFFAIGTAAGAALHLATHLHSLSPVIGASAGVSACMAAAVRFAFQRGGPLETWRNADPNSYRLPAEPLSVVLRNPRVIVFLVVWFGLNLLFGLGGDLLSGTDEEIAWQAHVGGFLAGLILFPVFDHGIALHHRSVEPSPVDIPPEHH